MSDDLAARLQQLEDREAIRNLISRYAFAVDDHDFNVLATLWAPNARYGFYDEIHAQGAEKIAALLKANIQTGGVSFHTNHDHVIEWTDDNPDLAHGILSCHAEVTVANEHQVSGIRYRDTYVRLEGKWLFAERLLGFLYFSPAEDYAGLLLREERLHLPGLPPMKAHWPRS